MQAESALRTELGTLTEKVEARFTAMGEKVEGRFSSLLGEVRWKMRTDINLNLGQSVPASL